MTTAADDRAVEEAFEASLAGRPVPGGAAGLAAFTSAVRSTATQPGRPNAALAELLSTGLLTDQSSPSTRTAPTAGSLPSRSDRGRTRRRSTVIITALIAKFLSAGAVAQAATGAGVVVVVVTGAGTVGVLPDGAQERFSDLTGINETVEEPTDDLTDPGTEPVEDGEDLADPTELPEVPVTEPVVDEVEDETGTEDEITEAEWLEGPEGWKNFGSWVSFGSHRGWATGARVSAAAHERNDARKGRSGDDVEDTDEVEVEDDSDVASDDDGNGNGNGNGRGNGNGKGRGGRN